VPAVVVEGLAKSYRHQPAVVDVSFAVEPGEVFALLGPNGAGKTTTVEILEGFRARDAGAVKVLGFDPGNRATSLALRRELGIVLQELAVEPFLTVREVLRRNARYYPAPRAVDEVIEMVGLAEKPDARVRTLSGGQQRRLDLGLGIIGNPRLVFLDEPTTGFDPTARRGAWSLVRDLCTAGTTVILTTHYMDEAEALADQVAVVRAGRIVATGPPQSLGGRELGEATLSFRLPAGVAATDLPVAPTSVVGDLVEVVTAEELAVLHRLTGWALERNLTLVGLTVARLTLEDVYLRLTGEEHQ
jgi:ABC-2 type transport system ATP-binding protein